MIKKLIVSNWKNHPDTLAEAVEIMNSIDEYLVSINEKDMSLIFCPPFVFVEEVGKILRTSHLVHQSELGAQDISAEDSATLTGEVSGPMLRKLGVRYVIVGHSERRWKLGESDEMVNKKLKAVIRNELIPIVCIGERTRDEKFKDFVKEQTLNTFSGLNADEVARCIVAYEPVWAISTTPGARPDTPESALESIGIIKNTLIRNWKLEIGNSPKVLYGGSINSANARDFLKEDSVNGVLVGGASIDKEEFAKVLSVVAELN
ncbi:MAG: triose-phosphate isomerase [Patescibacteria group bacterium]